MISEFTPPGIQVVANRDGGAVAPEVVKGRLYTVRGFVINRHWRTREPDPHVLLQEVAAAPGKNGGERGYPRHAFDIPTFSEPLRVSYSRAPYNSREFA
jgi:hypothetical protein